ncbi:MAG: hypothetical protein ACYC2Y_04060 [Armatimonadota bacterium]
MAKRIVLGVLIENRVTHAPEFQEIITQFGCNIKTRIGLHDVGDATCSPNGLILLEMFGDEGQIRELESRLRELPGFQVQKMEFNV